MSRRPAGTVQSCREVDGPLVSPSAARGRAPRAPPNPLAAKIAMAEDKKRKIDLKARLGKKTVKGGPSVPPPVGIPRPVGIPAPTFGTQPPRAAPKVDASDPYAAISAADAPEKQEQTLKVEMSQEVVQAQKKGKARILMLAIAMAAIGGLMGFTIGGRIESNKGAKAAVEGAQQLAKEVEEANRVVNELAETLATAKSALGSNKYPEEAVKALGGVHIPFEGANLFGKGIGRYNQKTQSLLLKYTSAAEAANSQKDTLQRILGAKKTVMDYLSQKENPKVRWSVYVVGGEFGPWAVMQPLPKPFLVKSDAKTKDKDGKEQKYAWPEEFKIKEEGKEHTLKRYTRGDPTGSEPKIIPVDPTTHDSVCPSDVLGKLVREVSLLEVVLRGDQTPGHEKQGLIELGEALSEALRKIGRP